MDDTNLMEESHKADVKFLNLPTVLEDVFEVLDCVPDLDSLPDLANLRKSRRVLMIIND